MVYGACGLKPGSLIRWTYRLKLPEARASDRGVLAAIKTYGETIHTLVERKNYKGVFMPGISEKGELMAGKLSMAVAIVIAGYLCGIVAKVVRGADWVTALYALNAVMVAVDLTLYLRLRPRPA